MRNIYLHTGERGSGGPWLSRRAGSKLYSSNVYQLRGAGWKDNLKSFLGRALAMVRKFIIPKLKQYGPSLAEEAAKYALTTAADYARKKNGDVLVEIVDKAAQDVPSFVGQVVRRATRDLPEQERGAGPEAVESTMRELVPALRSVAQSRLVPRLQALSRLGSFDTAWGMSNRLPAVQTDYLRVFEEDSDLEDEFRYLLSVINTLIQSVLVFMHNTRMPTQSQVFPQLMQGAMSALQQSSMEYPGRKHSARLMLANNPLDKDDETASSLKIAIPAPINLSPTARQADRIARTTNKWNSYSVKIKPSSAANRGTKRSMPQDEGNSPQPRGGILPLLIPAVAAGIPAVAAAISDIVYTWTKRGEGIISDQASFMSDLERRVADYNYNVERQMVNAILNEARNKAFATDSDYASFVTNALMPSPVRKTKTRKR